MSKKVLVTGSGGLIGSESVRFFCNQGFSVVGIDNDMRSYFFGEDASTTKSFKNHLKIYKNYKHETADIRDEVRIEDIFKENRFDLIIHTAAQPSHDWAAREPKTDFSINAVATLNLLENFRNHCPDAVFIFTSTNKVYGDTPNTLPLEENKTRYDLKPGHKFYEGIDESMSIDQSTHSLFGVSKASADLLVQEYGRYFGLMTACFRGGCLTGSGHAGAEMHGFLSYLVRAILEGRKYTIYGYKGKQVRDNIHSHDLINAFHEFYKKPRSGEVYNIGGSRFANVSVLEAIDKIEKISGRKANYAYSDENRIGDHIWYISSVKKFQDHFPNWKYEYDIDSTIEDICKNSSFSEKYYSFSLSKNLDYWREKNWYFHNSLQNIFKNQIPEGSNVLQIGYGLGDILGALYPKNAVSIDEDERLLSISKRRYPSIDFRYSKPEEIKLNKKFDYVILPNSVDHFYDIQSVLENSLGFTNPNAKLIITSTNPRWQQLLDALESAGLKRPEEPKNWLRLKDLENVVELSGYELEESGYKVLLPMHVPLLSKWINNKLQGNNVLAQFCLVQYVIAKKAKPKKLKDLTSTVLIPCFNEEGNVRQAIETVPKMGKKTTVLVVDDGSTDKTVSIVKQMQKTNKNLKLISYRPNRGKGIAVKTGFDAANTDVIMIQDADMTVPPEELPRFFAPLASGKADFINGTRLIYPMEDQAMRQANLVGNLVFSWIFSWLLGARVTDTLCGTKALFKKDYKKIKMTGRSWGDFDLLFGAAENKLRIKEVPVHYKKRVAGESKMKAFKHGVVMLQNSLEGLWRLKING